MNQHKYRAAPLPSQLPARAAPTENSRGSGTEQQHKRQASPRWNTEGHTHGTDTNAAEALKADPAMEPLLEEVRLSLCPCSLNMLGLIVWRDSQFSLTTYTQNCPGYNPKLIDTQRTKKIEFSGEKTINSCQVHDYAVAVIIR